MEVLHFLIRHIFGIYFFSKFVSCVFAVLPKCASNGFMRVVLLGANLMFSIMCVCFSASVSFAHLRSVLLQKVVFLIFVSFLLLVLFLYDLLLGLVLA